MEIQKFRNCLIIFCIKSVHPKSMLTVQETKDMKVRKTFVFYFVSFFNNLTPSILLTFSLSYFHIFIFHFITGWTLADFMNSKETEAGLKEDHVVALRLYTTAAYKHINDPSRDQQRIEQKKRHPFAATVKKMTDGIKLLRSVQASKNQNKTTKQTILWRGMKHVHASASFHELGGTELASMSTTSDFEVACQYGTETPTQLLIKRHWKKGTNGNVPVISQNLLLKIKVPNALNHGAHLSWLSAFPSEAEVLYPPLTFLQPTGRTQEIKSKKGYVSVTILEVTADLSAPSAKGK